MNIFNYLVVGAVIGFLAQKIVPTNSDNGLMLDVVVGIAGASVAGFFISPLLGFGGIYQALSIPTMLISLLGSLLGLWIYRRFTGEKDK